jgi:hypothetical protein
MRVPLRVGALVLAVAALVRATVASAAADAPDQPALDRELVRAAAQLDAAARSASVHHAHADVPTIVLVAMPPQARPHAISVDDWVQSELHRIGRERATAMQVRELHELAQSLRRAASAQGGSAPAADPQALAAEILTAKVYAHERTAPAPPPRETLLDKIVKWLGGRLQDLLRAIFGAATAVPAVGRIILVAGIVVVAGAAAYLIYLLVSIIARRQRRSAPTMGTPLPALIHPEALYENAKAAARAGRYAQAVALLFQASLRSFDGSGKLPYDASLTPGEYRRAVRQSVAAASDAFDQIAKAFVLAAFAQVPMTEADFAAADLAYRTMRPLVIA